MNARSNVGSRPSGFSLLELTVVLAVTAVIGAVGVSAYRTYHVRAQIANGVALAAGLQDRVATAFKVSGVTPANRHAAGFSGALESPRGEHLEAIEVVDGRIEIRFGGTADPAIAGRTLSLTPFETADQRIVWICGNRLPGVGLHPLGFAGGARQPVQVLTMIEARYLPSTCR